MHRCTSLTVKSPVKQIIGLLQDILVFIATLPPRSQDAASGMSDRNGVQLYCLSGQNDLCEQLPNLTRVRRTNCLYGLCCTLPSCVTLIFGNSDSTNGSFRMKRWGIWYICRDLKLALDFRRAWESGNFVRASRLSRQMSPLLQLAVYRQLSDLRQWAIKPYHWVTGTMARSDTIYRASIRVQHQIHPKWRQKRCWLYGSVVAMAHQFGSNLIDFGLTIFTDDLMAVDFCEWHRGRFRNVISYSHSLQWHAQILSLKRLSTS